MDGLDLINKAKGLKRACLDCRKCLLGQVDVLDFKALYLYL